jgi:hypothetical protein
VQQQLAQRRHQRVPLVGLLEHRERGGPLALVQVAPCGLAEQVDRVRDPLAARGGVHARGLPWQAILARDRDGVRAASHQARHIHYAPERGVGQCARTPETPGHRSSATGCR